MSSSSVIYTNFFTPHTISLLLCLHQLQKRAQSKQIDLCSPLIQYFLQKILDISDCTKHSMSYRQFKKQLLYSTKDEQFIQRYSQMIDQMDSFNKFYGDMSRMLKALRSMRNSKLEQSNIIDFFIRRLYIYFQKLDFKEIVTIYERFRAYIVGNPETIKQHQFMLTKSIEEVKFNLQNYSVTSNPEELLKQIDVLAEQDHTYKTSYLKGLASAQIGKPMQSAYYLRRYFDKNLGNLFHDRLIDGNSGNKINHCILSNAYSSLQLNNLDQCLQSISEGLRISQNNSDEQSINNCIIYLYSIAEKLGKFREQILLAEHAITHSLNQSNLTLTLYSCLACSLFDKKYDCNDSSLELLKTREVSWKDALHFSKKKIHSQFQNNCRNIYHTYRNLLIPSFVHKLAVLYHLPSLQNLLINPYYEREELLELTVYKEFKGQNQLSKILSNAYIYLSMGCQTLVQQILLQLQQYLQNATPQQIINIYKYKSEVQYQNGSLMSCFETIEHYIAFTRAKGFTKQQHIEGLILLTKVLIKNQLFYDALVKIQDAVKICQKYQLNEKFIQCKIIKSTILLHVGEISKPISLLQQIQESGELNITSKASAMRQNRTPDINKLYYQAKLLLNKNILENQTSNNEKLKHILQHNIIECYNDLINATIEDSNLVDLKIIFQNYLKFIRKHPIYLQKVQKNQKCLKLICHCLDIFRKSQIEVRRRTLKKVMEKVKRCYSN